MTIQDWLTVTVMGLSIIASVGLAVRWIVRHYVKDIVSELRPNGGSSIKDQVTRLEAQHKKLESKVDKIYEVLIANSKPIRTTKIKK
jgi:hypothetical protein